MEYVTVGALEYVVICVVTFGVKSWTRIIIIDIWFVVSVTISVTCWIMCVSWLYACILNYVITNYLWPLMPKMWLTPLHTKGLNNMHDKPEDLQMWGWIQHIWKGFLNMHFKWRARMMAACDMVIITLEGGPVGGQLVCVISPAPINRNPSSEYPRRPWRG